MKYYKVIAKFDGTQVMKWRDSKKRLCCAATLIGNELYTQAELLKLLNGATLYGVRDCEQVFDPVEIKKTETYTCFGARFKNGEGHTV